MNIHNALHDFCKSISGGSPTSVLYQPEAWARTNHCFTNVKRKIEACGGDGQFGWQFMQVPVGTTPGFFVAVHHEVWKSPEGDMIDITPCVEATLRSETGLLFLADDTATLPRPLGYEVGISRPRKFLPLATTAKVRKIVEAERLKERQYWEKASEMMA